MFGAATSPQWGLALAAHRGSGDTRRTCDALREGFKQTSERAQEVNASSLHEVVVLSWLCVSSGLLLPCATRPRPPQSHVLVRLSCPSTTGTLARFPLLKASSVRASPQKTTPHPQNFRRRPPPFLSLVHVIISQKGGTTRNICPPDTSYPTSRQPGTARVCLVSEFLWVYPPPYSGASVSFGGNNPTLLLLRAGPACRDVAFGRVPRAEEPWRVPQKSTGPRDADHATDPNNRRSQSSTARPEFG